MILIKNAAGAAEFRINGDIIEDDWKDVYDWFGVPSTCPRDVHNQLAAMNGEPLTVWINSYGGHVTAGSAIYTALKSYRGEVTVKVDGIAASAASVIAMAGDVVKMSPTAELMIHNPATNAQGDETVMEQTAQALKSCKEAIINAYHLKTGLDRETLSEMMTSEEYISAQKAIELHFADEILFDEKGLLLPTNFNESRLTAAGVGLQITDAMKKAFDAAKKPEPPNHGDEGNQEETEKNTQPERYNQLKLEIELASMM